MTQTCEKLARRAATGAADVTGLELDETWTESYEVDAIEGGFDGTTYELAQRYVRTAGERVGYARSEDAADTLDDLVDEAMRQARTVERSVPAGALIAPGPGESADTAPDPFPAPDMDAMTAAARTGLALLEERAQGACEARCTVRVFDERRLVSNSCGLSRAARHRHYLVRMSYIATGSREMHDVTVRSYGRDLASIDLAELADRAVVQGTVSLDGTGIASGIYPVVISREMACRMLVGLWDVFSASKVATGQSLMANKVGDRVASEAVSLVEPAEEALGNAPGRAHIDAEGIRRTGHAVVDGGIFAAPLSDVSWARQLGIAPSGNAARREGLGRIVPNDVVIAPANLCVAPGSSNLDELLQRMGDGLYLTEIGDIYHSFNAASGSISAPVRGALVENGRIAKPVGAISITDSISGLLEHVVAVGDTLSWSDLEDLDAFWCGAPDLYVSELGIVGSAS